MEKEYSPEVVLWVNQFYSRFNDSFGFLAHLGLILVSGAAVIGAASLYCILAKKETSFKWIESTAIAAGIVSIPYCLFQGMVAAYIVFLEAYIGGWFGPGTSGQVYFIPTVLIHIFPLIGLAYLKPRVRKSCVALSILSFAYVIHEPILRWIADAS